MKNVCIYWRSGGQTTMTTRKDTDILAGYMDVLPYIKEITETDADTQEIKTIYKLKTIAETV